jgi:hypothetical protein
VYLSLRLVATDLPDACTGREKVETISAGFRFGVSCCSFFQIPICSISPQAGDIRGHPADNNDEYGVLGIYEDEN